MPLKNLKVSNLSLDEKGSQEVSVLRPLLAVGRENGIAQELFPIYRMS